MAQRKELLRFKINHSPRPKKKKKNNTLGYPIMKKGKEKKKMMRSPKNWDPKTHEGKVL